MTSRAPEPPVSFLVGPARSGTTLLYRVLCLHPDVTYVSNYVRRLPRLPELAVLNAVPRRLPRLQRAGWFGEGSNAYVYGGARTLAQRFLPAPVEGEPVFTSCGLPPYPRETALPPAEQVALLRGSLARLPAADGQRHLVSKRIAHNWRIPVLHEAFPAARFVSLVRDGRAVAASLSAVDWWPHDRVWWYGGTPTEWAARGGDPWELCARNWVEEVRAVRAGLAQVPPEQVLALRYEDLVAAPLPTARRVAEHLGLDPESADWHARLAALSFPDRNERWRSTLAGAARETVEAVQAQELAALGYAAAGDLVPPA